MTKNITSTHRERDYHWVHVNSQQVVFPLDISCLHFMPAMQKLYEEALVTIIANTDKRTKKVVKLKWRCLDENTGTLVRI